MKRNYFNKLKIALLLLAVFSVLFLFGCDKNQPENSGHSGNKENGQTVENNTDYSSMSDEEIIAAFMTAWENRDTAIMDELSSLSEHYKNNAAYAADYFEYYGYDCIFCWGLFCEEKVCAHDLNGYTHAVSGLEIRQSEFGDYGCAPEELEKLHPRFADIYYLAFTLGDNNVTDHLENCDKSNLKWLDQSSWTPATGEKRIEIYVCLKFDDARGHRIIVNTNFVPDVMAG
jgi:hypothetical protein